MAEMSKEHVRELAQVLGLEIPEPDLTDIAQRLNLVVQAMQELDLEGLEPVDPRPVLPPQAEEGRGSSR